MSLDPISRVCRKPRTGHLIALFTAAALLLGTTGCKELDARREIQRAGKLYEKGEFAKAVEIYEQVLEKFDSGEVGEVAHYNAGITYHKMFRPGVDTPQNNHVAKRATHHYAKYLEIRPKDDAIVGQMTQVWMDSGDYKSAILYWEQELAKNPKNTEIIGILASINRQAGDWEKAIYWHNQEAEMYEHAAAKANAFMNIAKLTSNKLLLNRTTVFWEERLRMADLGIAALQKAEPLIPDNPDIQNYLGTLYAARAEGHQAAWAQMIDGASARHHRKRWVVLRKAAEAKQHKNGNGNGKGEKPGGGKAKPSGANP